MIYIQILTLIFINIAALLLLYWLYGRPEAKKFYNRCSKIPLEKNHNFQKDNTDEK